MNKMHNHPRTIAFLCNYQDGCASTILEHIRSFEKYSRHDIKTLNVFGEIPSSSFFHFFDALVIHYSICIAKGGFLSKESKKKISRFPGLKILFIQDDYRWVNETVNACVEMGIDAIFGLCPQKHVRQLYPISRLPNLHIETVLTGYVSDDLIQSKTIPYAQRSIDVSYRARKLPYWIGSHTLQKWQIADRFLENVKGEHLVCDISTKEEDRLYGENWLQLLRNSKATLGTESGASICDFTGEIQENVESYVNLFPDATYQDVHKLYLKNYDGKIVMNVLSPRIFEAIAHRVLLVLYPGEFNDLLLPWKHYVPLDKNHGNINEVISFIKDEKKANEIIERAHAEILMNPQNHYSALVKKFDDFVSSRAIKVRESVNPLTKEIFLDFFEGIKRENDRMIDANMVRIALNDSVPYINSLLFCSIINIPIDSGLVSSKAVFLHFVKCLSKKMMSYLYKNNIKKYAITLLSKLKKTIKKRPPKKIFYSTVLFGENEPCTLKSNSHIVNIFDFLKDENDEQIELNKLLSILKKGDEIYLNSLKSLSRNAEDLQHLIEIILKKEASVFILNSPVSIKKGS